MITVFEVHRAFDGGWDIKTREFVRETPDYYVIASGSRVCKTKHMFLDYKEALLQCQQKNLEDERELKAQLREIKRKLTKLAQATRKAK